MTRRLLLLWVILVATPWAAHGQTTLQRLMPAPDTAAQPAEADPPHPQRLATDWWQYFADAGEQIDARVDEALARLRTLSAELESQGRDDPLPLVD